MKKILTIAAALMLAACGSKTVQMPSDALSLRSPDGKLELKFALCGGVPMYTLDRAGQAVVLPSRMGFELYEGGADLTDGFTLTGSEYNSFDETWEPVWGEEAQIRNHYNEMLVTLERKPVGDPGNQYGKGEVMKVRFRLYDDGLGFRYEFPLENSLTYFMIKDEVTEFAMTGDHTAWWIPGDYSTQEFTPTESKLSQVRQLSGKPRLNGGWPNTGISPTAVQTALQMKTAEGLYINIHEAAVLDYPTTSLDMDDRNFVFRTALTPDAEGVKGRMQAPCKTPWRSVMVCEKATDVLASRLILNLNEPCALDDVSWIHPVKYMGV